MKYDLALHTPYLNAPGSLGFVPPRPNLLDLSALGAFTTNPLSLGPRTPAHNRLCQPYPGGFLLHTGYPNPGLRRALRQHAAAWARLSLPVIVALLPQSPDEALELLRPLDGLPNLAGVEILLPPGISPSWINQLAARLQSELPIILRLPFDQAAFLLSGCTPELPTQIAAISLAAPRGRLPLDGALPASGRLYGPALFPQLLAALEHILAGPFAGLLPVIAGCGVYTSRQARALLDAGALAVQLDSILWRGGLDL